jgi:predicted RNA methylase
MDNNNLKSDINYNNLKSDIEGLYSLSHKEDADVLSNIIKDKYGNIKILDGTAGIGGNSISFGINFKNVISVEKDKVRFDFLVENIKNANLNIELINCSVIDYIKNNNETFDLIFLDPPWGGPNYKYEKSLSLSLDTIPLCKIITDLKLLKKIIVLKLPFNYNLNEFSKFNYQIYNIKNYLIVVI